MSKQSVLNVCIKNNPSINKIDVEQDLDKNIARFERFIRAAFNEEWTLSNVMFSHRHDKATARNEMWLKSKDEYAKQWIKLLIDLYDYKRIIPIKK